MKRQSTIDHLNIKSNLLLKPFLTGSSRLRESSAGISNSSRTDMMSVLGYRSEIDKTNKRMKSILMSGTVLNRIDDSKSINDNNKSINDILNNVAKLSVLQQHHSRLSELKTNQLTKQEDSESRSASDNTSEDKNSDKLKRPVRVERLQTVKEERNSALKALKQNTIKNKIVKKKVRPVIETPKEPRIPSPLYKMEQIQKNKIHNKTIQLNRSETKAFSNLNSPKNKRIIFQENSTISNSKERAKTQTNRSKANDTTSQELFNKSKQIFESSKRRTRQRPRHLFSFDAIDANMIDDLLMEPKKINNFSAYK